MRLVAPNKPILSHLFKVNLSLLFYCSSLLPLVFRSSGSGELTMGEWGRVMFGESFFSWVQNLFAPGSPWKRIVPSLAMRTMVGKFAMRRVVLSRFSFASINQNPGSGDLYSARNESASFRDSALPVIRIDADGRLFL